MPLHTKLEQLLDTSLPQQGRLFPTLTVDKVVKAYAKLRIIHPTLMGTVFHSTRKWFITQCERTGVPEHYTATLVGHHAARSANKLTYALYSGGISDAAEAGDCGWYPSARLGGHIMSPTTIADPSLIPDIEAFEERVAIHIYDGYYRPAKDLAAQAQGFRKGPLLGDGTIVEGCERKFLTRGGWANLANVTSVLPTKCSGCVRTLRGNLWRARHAQKVHLRTNDHRFLVQFHLRFVVQEQGS